MKKEPKPILKSISWLKNLFLTVCLLQATMPAFSQTKTVTGTVTDVLGEPLIGASVLVQGTSNGEPEPVKSFLFPDDKTLSNCFT